MNKKNVSLIYCDTYEHDELKTALLQSIDNLGGLSKYFNKGEKVLLKLNLLMKKKPEEATTTHPAFVKALSEILIDYGCSVLIGDSPGGPFNGMLLNGIYKILKLDEIAAETGAILNNNYNSFIKDNPSGVFLKKIEMTDMLNDVDKVISVSKFKTHGMMVFTGAVKNLFGTVPGIKKAEYHFNISEHDQFADVLIDICACVNPVLSFMDAIEGMEGAGPSSGTPRMVNAVIASESPYHLDKVAVSIISLPFDYVPTIKQSIKRGLTTNDLSDIELTGMQIDKFIINDFKLPVISPASFYKGRVPKFMEKIVEKLLVTKIKFDHDKCKGCKDCADNCPAKIIKMIHNKPYYDESKCIRCYCCQELCPHHAVFVYKPLLTRIFL